MSNTIKVLALAIAGATLCSAADASVLFGDNFNESGFVGSPDLLNNYSDQWIHTEYYQAVDNNGWTFTGRMLYAINSDNNDGALSLQEPFGGIGSAAASRTLTGLTPGQTYYVRFLMSGDNIPGQAYQLLASVDGVNVLTVEGVDGNPGNNPGTTETASFIATSSSAVLRFSENSQTLASPVIDNLSISDTAPPLPEPAAWNMMIVGIGLAGGALRRARRVLVTAGA